MDFRTSSPQELMASRDNWFVNINNIESTSLLTNLEKEISIFSQRLFSVSPPPPLQPELQFECSRLILQISGEVKKEKKVELKRSRKRKQTSKSQFKSNPITPQHRESLKKKLTQIFLNSTKGIFIFPEEDQLSPQEFPHLMTLLISDLDIDFLTYMKQQKYNDLMKEELYVQARAVLSSIRNQFVRFCCQSNLSKAFLEKGELEQSLQEALLIPNDKEFDVIKFNTIKPIMEAYLKSKKFKKARACVFYINNPYFQNKLSLTVFQAMHLEENDDLANNAKKDMIANLHRIETKLPMVLQADAYSLIAISLACTGDIIWARQVLNKIIYDYNHHLMTYKIINKIEKLLNSGEMNISQLLQMEDVQLTLAI